MSDQAFQQELTKRNLTTDDMREEIRRDLLANKMMEREVTAKVTVTDQDVTDFFNANKAQFNRTEEAYRIAQIVVTPVREPQIDNRSGDDAITPQQATAKMQMLMERLKAGVAFGDLAADYSEDARTAPRGGDLGFVPVSALNQAPPALRDAVLKTTPGSVPRGQQRRRPHAGARRGARHCRPERPEHAGRERKHHLHDPWPARAAAASGLPLGTPQRHGGGERAREKNRGFERQDAGRCRSAPAKK